VVDGLTGGGAAMLCKLNHALTDGVGAVEMAMSLFDDQERRGSCDPSPVAPAAATTGRLARVRDALSYESQLGASVLGGAVRAGQAMLTNGLRHPVDFVTGLYSTAASIYRTARPSSRPGSAIMHHRNLIRRLGVLDVSRPSLLAAGHNAGGTLNDAFIAAVAGGLRRYHLEHGAAIDDLVVTMPISVRTGSDPLGGNRAMLIRFAAPAGNADPTERIRIIHGRTDKARSEKALGYTQLSAGALARMPRWYVGAALRHVDFIASDVRGFPTPVFLAGAAVKAQYAFSPTLGAAVNVTLLSYIDTCALGMNVDVGAIPDYDSFFDCVAAGFDEVLALGEPS
jgi:WS/DGAT/MGAT family acyltransferase